MHFVDRRALREPLELSAGVRGRIRRSFLASKKLRGGYAQAGFELLSPLAELEHLSSETANIDSLGLAGELELVEVVGRRALSPAGTDMLGACGRDGDLLELFGELGANGQEIWLSGGGAPRPNELMKSHQLELGGRI